MGARFIRDGLMMIINLGRPWYPNIWPNVILDVSVKVFL